MTHTRPSDAPRSTQRRLPWRVLPLLSIAALVHPLYAQMHHVAPKERVTRAVGIYEWTGDLDKPKAARLVPLTLFINGRFEDAGVYLSRPVPFALETGDIYSIEKAGQSQGVFSLDHVRKVVPTMDPNADLLATAWYAYGKFVPPKPEPKAPVLKESAQKPVITSSADKNSGHPHFNNRSADKDSDTTSAPAKAPGTNDTKNKDAKDTSTASSSTTDSSRPVLHRSGDNSSQDSKTSQPSKDADDSKDSKDSKTSDTASDNSSKSKDNDIDRPTLRKRDPAEDAQRRKAASQSSVSGPAGSLNDDPDRPTMRKGASPGVALTAELTGLPADMQQAAAVSDAANREPHIFARDWESSTERAETLVKLEALAKPLVSAYVTTNQLTLGTPTAPVPTTATANTAPDIKANTPPASGDESGPKLQRGVPKSYQTPSMAKPNLPTTSAKSPTPTKAKSGKTTSAKVAASASPSAPVTLANEQLIPYTLSYGGLPTFVYSAQADVKTGGPVYITVVTQRLVSGEMQVALSSVTDATHLNRTPWMRPVDAVDPDVSHRASLLFELRAQSTRQFALYRLTSARAEQTFATGILP